MQCVFKPATVGMKRDCKSAVQTEYCSCHQERNTELVCTEFNVSFIIKVNDTKAGLNQ